MGKDPSRIRAEIEHTRARVGDDMDALGYKTDVRARVGDYVDDKKEAVRSRVAEARETATAVLPDKRALTRGAHHVRGTAERNPLGLAVGGLAVGFVVGTLLPQTRLENQQLGEMSDKVLDAAKDTAAEAVDRGKDVAQHAVGAAVEEAKESGLEQTQELASTLHDRVQEGGVPERSG
jgi:hypothetical protein